MRRLLLCLIAGFFVIASVPQAQESAFSGKNLAFTTGAASRASADPMTVPDLLAQSRAALPRFYSI